ncbi:MAG: hypothetical protein ACI4XW_07160 [Candidatus Spyradocola sp.]
MSSEVDGIGIIAAPVVLPAAVALGAGWLAWQGGKLLIDAGRATHRQAVEKRRQQEEAAQHRKMTALAAHSQLADLCAQILAQLESGNGAGGISGIAETEQLKYDLRKICEEPVPDDAAQIESLTSIGYIKLNRIIQGQGRIAALELSDSAAGLYRGLSVADLMDDLRIAIAAMKIKATVGKNVIAADPDVLERAKLNETFYSAANRIVTALTSVNELETAYGLTPAASAWFQSCFNGVDLLIQSLCRPTTSNKELKNGIRRLEQSIERYELMAPEIEHEIMSMAALYSVYADAAKALGEKVKAFRSFKSSAEIEKELKYLQKRVERAQECAVIYQKLGPAAYMCYAWDQELQAMGYGVHTRRQIMEMAGQNPKHAKLGENKLPFYQWTEEELTQLYSITSECSLQLIVHEDGAVSMQTIANANNGEVIAAQRSHCAQLRTLHERLRKNWFILYDFEETESSDSVTTITGWRASESYAWKDAERRPAAGQRSKEKPAEKAKQMQ